MQSMIALWLYQRFDLSLATAATVFFWTGVLSALSFLVAVQIARRIGLVNTMVFTHLPSSLCLIAIPFVSELGYVIALLFVRSALSQMDVPTRSSYVMAIVSPAERRRRQRHPRCPNLRCRCEPRACRLLAQPVFVRMAACRRRRRRSSTTSCCLRCFAACDRLKNRHSAADRRVRLQQVARPPAPNTEWATTFNL